MPRPNRDVEWRSFAERGQQLDAHDLAQPALEPVTIDSGMLMKRHDDSDARRAKRGSEDPDIEMRGPNSLPLSNDGLYVQAPRQFIAPRKFKPVAMRLRICSEA